MPGSLRARKDGTVERTLIVARMEPDAAESVAGIFGESDATELPAMVGVTAAWAL